MLYKHVYCDFNAFQVAFRPPPCVHWQPGIPRDAFTCLAFAVLRDFLTGATSSRCRPTTLRYLEDQALSPLGLRNRALPSKRAQCLKLMFGRTGGSLGR